MSLRFTLRRLDQENVPAAGESHRHCGLVPVAVAMGPVSYTHLDVYKRQPSDSPWITPDRIDREGVLFVWHAGRSQRPRLLERFTGLVTEKEERFTVRRWGHDAEVVIRYAILPPAR